MPILYAINKEHLENGGTQSRFTLPVKKTPYMRPAFEIFHRHGSLAMPRQTLWGGLRETASMFLDKILGRNSGVLQLEFACEIVEFGRMRATTHGEVVIIEVPEVAYHFRESPRHVRQSLQLLEMKGIAKRTRSRDHWRLIA